MRHHLDSFGKQGEGGVRSHVAALGFNYGLTDRLTFDADIPYVASRYRGSSPHVPEVGLHGGFERPFIDDGNFHGVFQDFRFNLRYNALRDPVVLTPAVAVAVPSHRYATFGHANFGRDLREYRVGFHLGRQFRPFLPRAYADLAYTYAFVEKLAGFDLDRSNVEVEVGYFLRSNLVLRGFGGVQKSHGGLENSPNFPIEFISIHDRLWRAHWSRLGGGATFSLSKNVDVFGAVVTNLSGKNAEAGTFLAFGVSWRFKKSAIEDMLPAGVLDKTSSAREPLRERLAAVTAQALTPWQ